MTYWIYAWALGCRTTVSTPPPEAAPEVAEEEAPALDPASDTRWADIGLKRHMQTHFSAATDGVWFLAHDRMEMMRVRVGELAHGPHPDLPVSLQPYGAAMYDAAVTWAKAPDAEQAAAGSAVLAERCAACHAASGAISPLTDSDVAMADLTPGARHSLASYLLWVGLIVPSDRAWTTGAANLAAADHPAVQTEELGEAWAA
ncbi:MAG: hypothetical protein AAF211_09915, partial [Myxococcota bacterium]